LISDAREDAPHPEPPVLTHLMTAASKRADLIARLANDGTRGVRLVSDLEEPLDLDAYGVDGGWVLFTQVNERSFLKRIDWKALAQELAPLLGGPVRLIGGAVKTPDGSEPLPIQFRDESAPAGSLVTMEGGAALKLELEGVLNPGLDMNQRDNRTTLRQHIATRGAGPLVNCFSYTGAFSVAAARAGCDTVSVDVSKRYLTWEGENQTLNGTVSKSRRIPEDSGTFLRRLEARVRKPDGPARPDFIVLDPPTFSRHAGRQFRVREALPGLVTQAASCLSSRGVMLVSTNDSRWPKAEFESDAAAWGAALGFDVVPGIVPEDFQPAGAAGEYALKSVWMHRR